MKFRQSIFWLTAFLAAFAFDFLFWGKMPGISFLIWVILVLAAVFVLAKLEKAPFSKWGILLVLLALACAAVLFLRREPLTMGVNFCLAVLAVLLLFNTFRNGFWVRYRLFNYVWAGIEIVIATLAGAIVRVGSKPAEAQVSTESAQPDSLASDSPSGSKETPARKHFPLGAILRGLFLAVPVVALLAGLLASADPIFSDGIKNIFDLTNLGEYVARFIIIFLVAYALTGLLLRAIWPTSEPERPDPQKTPYKPFLGWIEAVIVLSSVVALFGSFVSIQFQYFFGGAANISINGYTYAEYARRGFSEIVIVALLTLLLYMVITTSVRLETSKQRVTVMALSILLAVNVLVMLTAAFQRLTLYEQAYGFTRLRTYPHMFMIWLGLLFVWLIFLEVFKRRGRLTLAIAVCVSGFCLSLAIVNVDSLIARQNIDHAILGGELDLDYIRALSVDAVPTLLEQYARKDIKQEIHDQIGADLACRWLEFDQDRTVYSWQSYNLAVAQAQKLLQDRSQEWQQYKPASDNMGNTVRIQGDVIPCEIYDAMD